MLNLYQKILKRDDFIFQLFLRKLFDGIFAIQGKEI